MATRKSAASTTKIKSTSSRAKKRSTQQASDATAHQPAAGVAQQAERGPSKSQVAGSSPAHRSTRLTAKQRHFVAEYLRDKNGKQAAIRAGYSQATAGQIAFRLLRTPLIAAEVERLEAEQIAAVQQETGITLERTLREIAKVAFHDPRRFFTEDGNLQPITELDDTTAAALAGFEVVEERERNENGRSEVVGYTKKVRIADRAKHLDMLMKHLGGYKVDHDQHQRPVADALRDFFAAVMGGSAGLPIARHEARPPKPVPGVDPLVSR